MVEEAEVAEEVEAAEEVEDVVWSRRKVRDRLRKSCGGAVEELWKKFGRSCRKSFGSSYRSRRKTNRVGGGIGYRRCEVGGKWWRRRKVVEEVVEVVVWKFESVVEELWKSSRRNGSGDFRISSG